MNYHILYYLLLFIHKGIKMKDIVLTNLEDNILSLLALGAKQKDIIKGLEITRWKYLKTIKNIQQKLKTDTLVETVVKAVKLKYIAV